MSNTLYIWFIKRSTGESVPTLQSTNFTKCTSLYCSRQAKTAVVCVTRYDGLTTRKNTSSSEDHFSLRKVTQCSYEAVLASSLES